MQRLLSYDDVLLRPQTSDVNSLSSVDVSSSVAGIGLQAPVFSAPMDTVTEAEMAAELDSNGGCGVIHRFLTVEEQAEMVSLVDSTVAGAVGLGEFDRAGALENAGADLIVADIANGHMESFVEFVSELDSETGVPVAAGNVGTFEGAKALSESGADVIKIGIGPGSACTTREKTGVGVPQFSAVRKCSEVDADLIADGGIRKPGDAVKALMAGADAVMMGGVFADTKAAPRSGEFRGMSTKKAAEDRKDRDLKESDGYEEGEVIENEVSKTVEEVVESYKGGIKSGLSYCGGHTIVEARENAEFIEVTNSTQYRNGAHYG